MRGSMLLALVVVASCVASATVTAQSSVHRFRAEFGVGGCADCGRDGSMVQHAVAAVVDVPVRIVEAVRSVASCGGSSLSVRERHVWRVREWRPIFGRRSKGC